MTAVIGVALAAALILAGCGGTSTKALPNSAPTTVTVTPVKTQGVIGDQSLGLSFETSALNEAPFARGNLAQYLRTLGDGVIRIGGNSADESFWTSANESAPSWSVATVTPNSLKNLASIADTSGWQVILTVDLKHLDATRAADEARLASQILGPSLLGIAIGNEPEQYYSNANQYLSDFNAYAAAIKAAAPGAKIVGGDIQNSSGIMSGVLSSETSTPTLDVWSRHFYPTHACDGNRTSIDQLLSSSSDAAFSNAVSSTASQGAQLHVPAFLDETNSTACEGQHGVSDTMASALWALQSALQAGRANVGSIEFHSTVGACNATSTDTPEHFYYSPLCAANKHDEASGDLEPAPEYFGLLAQHLAGTGTAVETSSGASTHIRAFAIANGSQITLIMIDVDSPSMFGATPVTVKLGKQFMSASQVILKTTSPKGLSATNQITLGTKTVGSNGEFKQPSWINPPVNNSSFNVTVAPATATIIRFTT